MTKKKPATTADSDSSYSVRQTVGNLTYSSAKMFARRRKMLEEARVLIEDSGYDGFTIRDLCKRAKVSPQTVYRAFESKERLAALSIRHFYDSFEEVHSYVHAATSLEGVLERLIVNHHSMSDVRQYVTAIVSIYFTPSMDAELRMAASHRITTTLKPWITSMWESGGIRRGISEDQILRSIVSLLFAISVDWCSGDLSDDEFLDSKLEGLLTYAMGATRGAAHTHVREYLVDLLGPRERIAAIESQIVEAELAETS